MLLLWPPGSSPAPTGRSQWARALAMQEILDDEQRKKLDERRKVEKVVTKTRRKVRRKVRSSRAPENLEYDAAPEPIIDLHSQALADLNRIDSEIDEMLAARAASDSAFNQLLDRFTIEFVKEASKRQYIMRERAAQKYVKLIFEQAQVAAQVERMDNLAAVVLGSIVSLHNDRKKRFNDDLQVLMTVLEIA